MTPEKLDQVFSERTKLVLFNNPQNPTGVVYDRAQMQLLADYCVRFNAYAVCDEVWEHVVFDGLTFEPLMALPGMRERTVKISSAGKIFGMTGWKVGLVFAAPHLMKVLSKAHQFLTFTTPPNLQAAVAYGLGKPDDYFTTMRAGLQRSRDRLAAGLKGLGFEVLPSRGTYFLSIDLAATRQRLRRRGLLPRSGQDPEGRGDPGLRLLRGGCCEERGALLLRQARCDHRPGAGASGRPHAQVLTQGQVKRGNQAWSWLFTNASLRSRSSRKA